MDGKSSAQNGIPKEYIMQTPDEKYTPDSGGMGIIFYQKMKSYGNAIAQIDGVTGAKDTYASLLQRSVRTAIKMRSLGVTSNDIVTICTINHLDCCVPYFASLFLGAKTANLDPSISLNDTCFLLNIVLPKIIFVGEEAINLIENAVERAKLKTKIIVFGKSTKHLQFSSFLLPSVAESYFVPVKINSNEDTTSIFFSSGTTGFPKGICLNHNIILGRSYQFCNLGINLDVILGYASMYWISSVIYITSSILTKGCRLILPSFNPQTICNSIAKYKATFLLLAPTQAIHLCNAGRPPYSDTSSLKHLMIAGGNITKEFINRLRIMLPDTYIFTAYGQTETSITCCYNFKKPEDIRFLNEKFGSSGKILDGITYKVVDPDTQEILGPYCKGELCIKSKFQMNGYYNIDSSEVWDKDGFLKTGDIVYYDEDYCIYIVDRVKDMMKYQMWHIPPAILEGVLQTHPAVHAAVVVGLPHPIDGDHPMAAVVLKESFIGKTSESELLNFVNERVDERQKLRGGVKLVEKIPITPSGKFKRTYIRDLVVRREI